MENFDNNNQDNNEPDLNENKSGSLNELTPAIPPLTAGFFGLIAIFILYQIGGGLLTLMIFGMDVENADVNLVRLLTMGGQVMFILFPALLLTKLVYQDVTRVIRLKIPSIGEILFFTIGLIILTPLLQNLIYIQDYIFKQLADAVPIINSLKELLDQFGELVEKTYTKMLSSSSFVESAFIVLVVAVTPAICEEVFFRGYLQKSFELKTGKFLGALITAIFFGLYHFNPYGFIGLTILGLYFGFVTYTSNSILIAVVLHFLNNFIAIVAYLTFGTEDILSSEIANTDSIGLNVISFFLLLSIFFTFIYYAKKKYNDPLTNK
ncbi:MAG: CPBP family intramembrane metalloprotease [Melioribacteraceae bacterium]|nr:CPBP family intramembrane metalloprotease [Melioribacteraceae bacterium]